MNKTLALIAALGLVVSAPAFAADEGTATPETKASAEAPAKPETKATSKEKVASTKSKEATTAAKTEAKTPKATELAPAAGGSKFDKSEKSEKTGTQN